jgi:flavin-dependent dehydrogenase
MLNSRVPQYDCAIIGGGLAGLCLSIQLAKLGHKIVLFEKGSYPFHKVCGEYISMESYDFIQGLGLNLDEMKLPKINRLVISAHNGYSISSELPLGGFGISRYTLDCKLAEIAKKSGVTLFENCTATKISPAADAYTITSTKENVSAKVVFGSYGKLEPGFLNRPAAVKKGSYIAVKYHVKLDFPNDLIELHNFDDGYCGISKVDNNTVCICYLTTVKNLQSNNNSIKELEENCVLKNPHLQSYFSKAEFMFERPLTISQISFKKKQTKKEGLFLVGDAAGAIAPLCGNGMSIAMRSSKIMAHYTHLYLQNKISEAEMTGLYKREWNSNFSFRIRAGYYLQKLFGKRLSTFVSLKLIAQSPWLFRKLISFTHGKKF